jgi:hypothetical protein
MIGSFFPKLNKMDERDGLNFVQRVGANLDYLIHPNFRGGDIIRQQGARNLQQMKRNRSIEELQKRADQGDAVAARFLDGLNSGALDPAQAFSGYLNEVAANERAPREMNMRMSLAKASAAKKTTYKSMTGDQINKLMGTNLPADKLFNLGSDGKVTQVGGGGITIGGSEKAWERGIGELGVKTLEKIQNDAASAVDMLGQTQILTSLMNDPNFRSGALAEPQMAYKKIVEALGGDAANVGSQEAFQAVTAQLILDKMGGSLGAGFSEGDRKFVESMAPRLSTSLAGNKLIIAMNNAVANRKIQINDFANKYIEENGMLDQNFNAALSRWAAENPIFVDVNPENYF